MYQFLYLIVVLASFSYAVAASSTDHPTLVIDNVTIIDAKNGSRANKRVLIRQGLIEDVRPGGGPISDDVSIIDGSGKYLIPGLWDAHVHFTYDKEVAGSMLPLFLANGITSVRDTGGLLDASLKWKRYAASQPFSNPRVFIAGPLLDGAPSVYDGSNGFPELAVTVATVEEAKAQVDRLAEVGVDFIKAYEMLRPDVYRAILKQASLHGLPVAGHIPLAMTANEASDAGLDSIEHFRNLELACTTEEADMVVERETLLNNVQGISGGKLRQQAHAEHRFKSIANIHWPTCERVIERHRRNGTRHVPTLALVNALYKGSHTNPKWRATFNFLPENLRKQWYEHSNAMANMFTDDPEGDVGRTQYLMWSKRVVSTMADDGMLLAGTDTPIFFMTPGFSLQLELEELVRAGLSPLQALEAATLTPARFFGLEKNMGLIAPGMVADLVLLSADPIQDILNTQKIDKVIRAGKVHDRMALDNLLQQASKPAS